MPGGSSSPCASSVCWMKTVRLDQMASPLPRLAYNAAQRVSCFCPISAKRSPSRPRPSGASRRYPNPRGGETCATGRQRRRSLQQLQVRRPVGRRRHSACIGMLDRDPVLNGCDLAPATPTLLRPRQHIGIELEFGGMRHWISRRRIKISSAPRRCPMRTSPRTV